ncbi:hypothetical protein [Microbulbifer aggregans]|uniref:hypothetical protein n=1 Tax=Microbulbifer aggregans TaxID=1769779 RepID=UPI001CFEB13C|nr:hypothetical protein [Microbulbifer aggregans]
MKKASIAVLVPVLGVLAAVCSQIVLKANSGNFAFGLSSDFWGGFVISAGIGLMVVMLGFHFSKSKDPV